MTEKELQSAFERNGLKRIAPLRGEKFDPHKHQAMTEQPGTDVAAGGVVEVMQPGYELLGRLVRPAMVVVAAKGAGAEPPAQANGAGPNPYAGDDDADPGAAVDRRA
jgi:molecular chaperone GrpE